MRVGLFGYESDPMFQVALRGLQALGHEVIGQIASGFRSSQALRNLDAAVMCGLRGPCGEAAKHYAGAGVNVCIIDYPHLRVPGYWRVTPPFLGWLPDFEDGAPTDRLDRLGIELQTRKRVKGQRILIVGQRSGDPTHGMDRSSFEGWVRSVVERIRAVDESEIVWRPHPSEIYRVAEDLEVEFSDPGEESLAESLEGIWLVVAYNSTAGLEAMIAGVPVIADGEALYSELAGSIAAFAKAKKAPDHDQLRELLARVAYTQWDQDEIASGIPFAALIGEEPLEEIEVEEAEEVADEAEVETEEPNGDAGGDQVEAEVESGGGIMSKVADLISGDGEAAGSGETDSEAGSPPAESEGADAVRPDGD